MKIFRSNSSFNVEYIQSVRKDYYFLDYYYFLSSSDLDVIATGLEKLSISDQKHIYNNIGNITDSSIDKTKFFLQN